VIYLVLVLSTLIPGLAQACPVCGFGQDGSQTAFLLTTGILTFLPLILVIAAIFYIRQRVKEHRYDEQ